MFFSGGFPGGFPGGAGFQGGMGRGDDDDKPVDNESYYKLLGVERSSTPSEIKKAYQKLARTHHPDKGGDSAKFQEIQSAYDVLSDEEKRELYNEGGKEAVERGQAGGSQADVFAQMFGGGGVRRTQSRGPRKGEPDVNKLPVTLEQLYNGRTVKLAVSRQRVKYPEGMSADTPGAKCDGCNGHGQVIRQMQVGPGMYQRVQAKCPQCNGLGKAFKGVTTSQEKKQLEIRVEPGMKHGQKVVLNGEADEQPGMEAGDVVFVLAQEKHERFERKGADLIMEKEISLKEALGGCQFSIKTLDDRTIIVKSIPGEVIKPNSLRMIAGEGMPRYKRPFEKGRLFIVFRVKFPDSINDEKTRKDLRKLLPNDPPVQDLPPTSAPGVEVLDHPMQVSTPEEIGRISFAADTGNHAYESDEDEEGGGGGPQQMRCPTS